ncbi:PucR family transcriptional regulator [Nocardiopsis oceani]
MDAISSAWCGRLTYEVTQALLLRYRAELPGYEALEDSALRNDVDFSAGWHSGVVLAADPTRHHPEPNIFVNSAIRRFDQGVPLQSLLRSYEMWAEELWRLVLDPAFGAELTPGRTLELAAALTRHVETARSSVERTYINRGLRKTNGLRSDLLRELLSTDEQPSNFVHLLAVSLRLDLSVPHSLVLVRARDCATVGQEALQQALQTTTQILSSAQFAVPVSGLDGDDVVAVCALGSSPPRPLRETADDIAQRLSDFVVGVSSPYRTIGGFKHAYLEALNAITYAPSRGERRAFSSSEALVNRILRQSELAEELRQMTIAPVENYDREQGSELLVTLQTYAEAQFALSTASTMLHVHPNTVRYRLHRVHDLTGHDPLTSPGIFVLLAGLRLIGPTD